MILLGLAALWLPDEVGDLLRKAQEADRARPSFTARLTMESGGRGDEPARVVIGRLAVRREEAARRARIDLEGGRAMLSGRSLIEVAPGGRRAVVTDLAKAAVFHPLESWCGGLSPALRERFDVKLARPPEGAALPSFVGDARGRPRAPVAARIPGALPGGPNVAHAGAGPWARHHALVVEPKDRSTRESAAAVRLFVNLESFRVERIVVETPGRVVTYRLDRIEEPAKPDAAPFEIDLSGMKVERR